MSLGSHSVLPESGVSLAGFSQVLMAECCLRSDQLDE